MNLSGKICFIIAISCDIASTPQNLIILSLLFFYAPEFFRQVVTLRIHILFIPCVVHMVICFLRIHRHSNKIVEASRNFWTSRFSVSDYLHSHIFPLSIILSDIKYCCKQVFTTFCFEMNENHGCDVHNVVRQPLV